MLYIYYGSDTKKTADAVMSAVEKLRTRAPHASVERVTNEVENFSLESFLASAGLFHAARVVILDGLFESKEFKEEVFDKLKELAASEHVFFIRETSLTAAEIKKLEKATSKIVSYDVREKKSDEFNTFALSDALLAKDKKKLWVLLGQALRRGVGPEELHGILFWGAKNLLLAGEPSAKEAGMHPFVYKKTQAARAKFKPGEAESLVATLAELPHKSRRAGVELEYALEEFVLGR